HVTIETTDPYRMVACHRVDPVAARQLAAPQGVIPIAAQYPGALGQRRGVLLNAPNERGRRLRVAQLHRRQREAAIEEMHVGVDESRHQHRAVRVDDARVRSGHLSYFGARSHRSERVAAHRDRVRPGTRRVARPHARVHDDHRHRRRCGVRGRGHEQGQERERDQRRAHSATLHRVANVQQNLEVQLLAPIGEIERRHLRLILRRLGTLERLAVHLVEVGQDAIARTGHTDCLEGSKDETGRLDLGRRLDARFGSCEKESLGRTHESTAWRNGFERHRSSGLTYYSRSRGCRQCSSSPHAGVFSSRTASRAITPSSSVGMEYTATRESSVLRRAGAPTHELLHAGSSRIPSHSIPSRMRVRTTGEFSPIPPVNTTAAAPPNAARYAPTYLRARYANISMANRACSSSRSTANNSRMSAVERDTPSRPDRVLSHCSTVVALTWSCWARNATMAGSRSPLRVLIIRPSSGVKPMLVSADRPPRMAAAEHPLPRCSTMSVACSDGVSVRWQYRARTLRYDRP